MVIDGKIFAILVAWAIMLGLVLCAHSLRLPDGEIKNLCLFSWRQTNRIKIHRKSLIGHQAEPGDQNFLINAIVQPPAAQR
jgi:hypothetical protein